MSSFTIQLKHKQGQYIRIVTGKEAGRNAWYIVLVDKLKLPIFDKMMHSGNYDLPRIGSILHLGWGDAPPEDLRLRLIAKYANAT